MFPLRTAGAAIPDLTPGLVPTAGAATAASAAVTVPVLLAGSAGVVSAASAHVGRGSAVVGVAGEIPVPLVAPEPHIHLLTMEQPNAALDALTIAMLLVICAIVAAWRRARYPLPTRPATGRQTA
jgi:hypothetical protein